ncbi:hypothetical protein [Cyclobacterium plantarum]|uniref:Uncharacterized protein n=1 Tax=Cyclobacterium plantarum TaxID=2716263 RepID=A0ABX0HD91_9BACT|nr:hypothetical protein [Cyclobacterium plantarum]NHE57950.1 hypothetical protein [Cyclobacterium plantarum]
MTELQLNITRGDSKSFQLNFFDENENPLDIQNNYDGVYLDISSNPTRQTEEIKLDLQNGISFGLSSNQVVFTISYLQTQLLYLPKYYGDVKLKNGSVVKTYFRIIFSNLQSTTKI